MLDDMVVFVKADEAVKTAPAFTLKNSLSVLRNRKEILLLEILLRFKDRRWYDASDLSRKNDLKARPSAFTTDDLQAPFRFKPTDLLINSSFGRRCARRSYPEGQLLARRLEPDNLSRRPSTNV